MTYWNKDGESYDAKTDSPKKLWASYCDTVSLSDNGYKSCIRTNCAFYKRGFPFPDCINHCVRRTEEALYIMGYSTNPFQEGYWLHDEYDKLEKMYREDKEKFDEYKRQTENIVKSIENVLLGRYLGKEPIPDEFAEAHYKDYEKESNRLETIKKVERQMED